MSLFGTDGVRGVANKDLSPDLALRLGRAAGLWLGKGSVVIGRDTRRSGPMLESSLSAGFNSAGIDVVSLGIAPTPAVSFACRTADFAIGAVISASHNPAEDNGIKFLCHDGKKLSDDIEKEIESLLNSESHGAVGCFSQDFGHLGFYREWLREQVPERLDGFRVAVDCANGAAYSLAPAVLRDLGAEVIAMNCEPDGDNINLRCGATHPAVIQELTLETGATLGISFDGDADRCVFSDETGALINGDKTMGAWAAFWKPEPRIVVGTIMSNMGFELALNELGVRLERSAVGDKHVAEKMAETGAKIGGEQSGHIIFSELAPTGDGLLTALQFLRILKKSGVAASELPPRFENWPQLLVNVRVGDKRAWPEAVEIHEFIEGNARKLGRSGRINVRPSGTQPMIRVMVEAKDANRRDEMANAIVRLLEDKLNGVVQSRVDLTNALGD